MNTTRIIPIISALVLVLVTLPASADDARCTRTHSDTPDNVGNIEILNVYWGPPRPQTRPDLPWGEALGFTREQETAVRSLLTATRRATQPLRAEIANLKGTLRAAWQVSAPNAGTIKTLWRDIHQAKGELAEYRIRFVLDVVALLTPEQRNQMRSFRKQRRRQK